MVRPVNCMGMCPLSDVICYEVSYLIRSSSILEPLPPSPALVLLQLYSSLSSQVCFLFQIIFLLFPYALWPVLSGDLFLLHPGSQCQGHIFGSSKCKETLVISFSFSGIFFSFSLLDYKSSGWHLKISEPCT